MNKFFILLIIFCISTPAFAASINPAAYRTMQMQSYRNNYNKQVRTQPMPYWQAQSNFSTRNRVYDSYQNYANYNNSVNQYNYNIRMMRYGR